MSRAGRLARAVAALAAVLATALAVGGCVAIPTSGPVEKIAGQPPECTNCVNVDVDPPTPGQDPKQIVEGFLRATSNFQPNYSVARAFLTPAAAERWSPEDGVQIYSGGPETVGNQVVVVGRLVGQLGPDRTYAPRDQPLRLDLGLVRQPNGEWRISRPPAGLLVAEFAFDSFYQPYNLYFPSSRGTLVPDPIYLPNLRNPAWVASVLMRSLLSGPSRWLKPAVTSAIPVHTALRGDAVTISDGIADVALSDPVLTLNDAQRRLLTAQVLYTLKPLGIQGVRFTVNQQPFSVPQADSETFVVSVEASFGDLDPVPAISGDELYAMRSRGVEQIDGQAEVPDPKPMPGPLGTGQVKAESLAVSPDGGQLGLVTHRGTTLLRASTTGAAPQPVLRGVANLLRPQFSRYGELWAIGERAGRQRLWVIGGRSREISLSALGPGRITAFKLSPDGSRLAAIRTVGGRTELGLARIARSREVVIDGWRPLKLNRAKTPSLSVLRDVGWVGSTDLIVLGGASARMPLAPYRITQDAFKITAEGDTNNADGVSLSASLSPSAGTVILDNTGQSWRDNGAAWVKYLDKVRAIAYPG